METAWLSKPPPSVAHQIPTSDQQGIGEEQENSSFQLSRGATSRKVADSRSPYCTFTPGATKPTHTKPRGSRDNKRTARKAEAGAESEAEFEDKSSMKTEWTPHASKHLLYQTD